jgi:hypothetical protein
MAPHPDSQGTLQGPTRPRFEMTGAVPAQGSMSKSNKHVHLRFQAVVIASQLPDNTAEALLVLDYARLQVLGLTDDSSGVSIDVQRVSGSVALRPC